MKILPPPINLRAKAQLNAASRPSLFRSHPYLMFFSYLVAMLLSFGGRGQYITPSNAESTYQEGSSTWENNNSNNTGTDAIMNSQGQLLQFSTSDGANGGIYWKEYSGTNGGISFTDLATNNPQYPEIAGLMDPDLAIATNGTQIVVVLVGISPLDNRVHYYNFNVSCGTSVEVTLMESACPSSYKNNGLGFAIAPGDEVVPDFAFGSFVYWPLGNISSDKDFMFSRRCKSPNVDANASGDVVITWVEDAVVGTPFQATAPFASFMNLTSPNLCIKWRQGNVMSAQGHISDPCYKGRCNLVRDLNDKYYIGSGSLSTISSGGYFGDFVASKLERTPNNYFYQAADVAISQQPSSGKPIISYSFFRYTNKLVEPIADPALITTQINLGGCYFNNTTNNRINAVTYKDNWGALYGLYGDIPRIAAGNKTDGKSLEDFVVILSTTGAVYNCALETILAPGSVGLYWQNGVYEGARRANNETDVSSNPVANGAIAYNSDQNIVTAVWDVVLGTNARDIVAKDFFFGTTSTGFGLPVAGSDYSLANLSRDNNQEHPSVASRNTSTMRGYFWADKDPSPNTFKSRLSDRSAGQLALNQPSTGQMQGYCYFEVDPDATRMGVYPNPSTNTQELVVKDDDVLRVEIYGQLNQLMLKSDVKDKKLVDGTDQKLAQGLYTVKFFTPTGTRISKLVIQ
jgi:hypothetical protein